ncbi:hypothetical protein [Robiginitalea sediminis]|uniref:hypothetical protein n=1 Tax=Robiginitalea sediminis TaxID=1982593 RepID=UPI001303BE01|nr:hypothetical protein [Robiginitalea sediminis]
MEINPQTRTLVLPDSLKTQYTVLIFVLAVTLSNAVIFTLLRKDDLPELVPLRVTAQRIQFCGIFQR